MNALIVLNYHIVLVFHGCCDVCCLASCVFLGAFNQLVSVHSGSYASSTKNKRGELISSSAFNVSVKRGIFCKRLGNVKCKPLADEGLKHMKVFEYLSTVVYTSSNQLPCVADPSMELDVMDANKKFMEVSEELYDALIDCHWQSEDFSTQQDFIMSNLPEPICC